MRKGEARRDWSVKEEQKLIELSGRISFTELCQGLGRTPDAVRAKVRRLHAQGVEVSTRYWEPSQNYICPSCGRLTHQVDGKSGLCRPCEIQLLIVRADTETAHIMRQLPQDVRARYERTEQALGSSPVPRPKAPHTDGLTIYEVEKVQDRYQIELEQWRIKSLTRELKRKRRRLQRMKKKLRNSQNQ